MAPAAAAKLMSMKELSEMLSIPVDTIYGWRHRGQGPPGIRVGKHVRFRRSVVEAWLEERAEGDLMVGR